MTETRRVPDTTTNGGGLTLAAEAPVAGQPSAFGRPKAGTRYTSRSPKGIALWFAVLGMATLSFNVTRVADWTVSDLLFLASAGAIVFKLLIGDERGLAPKQSRRGSQLVLVGAMLMLTFGTLSAFASWNPLASMLVIARMAWSTLVWFWIMRAACADRSALSSLIGAYQVSVIISAIVAVLAENGVAFTSTEFGDRQPAFTYHPGELMNFLVSGFFFFLIPIFVPARGGWPQRATVWWSIAVVIVVLGIFATGSTSALIALGVATIVVAAVAILAGSAPTRRRRSPGATLLFAAAIVAGAMALFASDAPIVERLNGYSEGSLDDSLESRATANSKIIENLDRYLVVGIGPYFPGGAGDLATSQFGGGGEAHNGVHNMPLKMLYEYGLIAVVGLWIIILATLRQAYKLVISTKGSELYPVALALLGSLVAAVTSSMFGPTNYARHYWLPFALIGCLWALRRRELSERATSGRRLRVGHGRPPPTVQQVGPTDGAARAPSGAGGWPTEPA
jgi:hypothetical protein